MTGLSPLPQLLAVSRDLHALLDSQSVAITELITRAKNLAEPVLINSATSAISAVEAGFAEWHEMLGQLALELQGKSWSASGKHIRGRFHDLLQPVYKVKLTSRLLCIQPERSKLRDDICVATERLGSLLDASIGILESVAKYDERLNVAQDVRFNVGELLNDVVSKSIALADFCETGIWARPSPVELRAPKSLVAEAVRSLTVGALMSAQADSRAVLAARMRGGKPVIEIWTIADVEIDTWHTATAQAYLHQSNMMLESQAISSSGMRVLRVSTVD